MAENDRLVEGSEEEVWCREMVEDRRRPGVLLFQNFAELEFGRRDSIL